MTMITDTESPLDGGASFSPETPFAEAMEATEATAAASPAGFVPWVETFSPFAESGAGGPVALSEQEAVMAEAYAALRDEEFDEALAELVSEVGEAVDQRLVGEGPLALGDQRERLGEAHLTPIAFESEQYLDRLVSGLAGIDVSSLSEQQLGEVLERFDPAGAGLTPAGEEFLGGLVKKAKSVVKTAIKTAGKVAKAALPLIGPVLKKLKALVRPLLKRVLAIAINRLPTPLHAPARLLARKLGLGEDEALTEAVGEASSEAIATSPVAVGDPELLAESFDAALAEALGHGEAVAEHGESFGYGEEEQGPVAEPLLETVGAARQDLVTRLGAATDGADVAPAIQQFVPAILPALRLGIRLVGRPRVVSFLSNYVAALIRQWVGPAMARPLSSAIVDAGLRLVSLEQAEPGEAQSDAAPAVLAATIEDTVRRLAENEDYVFEDEDLLQLATAEAFEQAVGSNFPAQFVRPDIHVAPTLGGSFVTRHAGRPFSYKKYSQAPVVEIGLPLAQAVRTFGGTTLAASLATAGRRLPFRARLHIYESTLGTSLPRLVRLENLPGLGSRRGGLNQIHPLTPDAAAQLLSEPRLGVRVPRAFLGSRHRIAAGQRFYYLEPLQAGAPAAAPAAAGRCAATPSRTTLTIDLVRSEVVVALYFSEADAQSVAASVRQGRGPTALLKALVSAYDALGSSFERPDGRVRIVKEHEEGEELLGPLTDRVAPLVMGWMRRKLREWSMKMLAEWVRARSQEFVRVADDSRCGVTVLLTLRGVPGLALVRQAINGQLDAASLRKLSPTALFTGSPNGTVAVTPGRRPR